MSNILLSLSGVCSCLSEHMNRVSGDPCLDCDIMFWQLFVHLRTDASMNKKCFYKWTVMFLHYILSLDHSNWNSREINWSNIRRKSHYSWRKRDVWPNSSWRMARRSKTFQITPIQVHSLCNANIHDSRHPESAIMPCTVPLLCWRGAICMVHGKSDFGLTH